MPSESRAERVWKRLLQSYGSRFTESFGQKPTQPWIDAIEDLTNDQISYGLRACLRVEPVHPPTLGVFIRSCAEMPIAQHAKGPTIQEQLCDYVMLKHFPMRADAKFTSDQMRQTSQTGTYLYREWRDETRPKGFERCAECAGVLIPAHGSLAGFRVNVADMLADPLHGKVMQRFYGSTQKGGQPRELSLTG